MSLRWDAILGGFAIFMFGIDLMGDSLKAASGDKLREYIDRFTSKPIYAIIVGIIITIIMQSSSASTAITIGLVRAGLMNLEQAAGIVMGANIGTTITSFLFSLSIDDYALYFCFIGFIVRLFAKSNRLKFIGTGFIGFGMIFWGLSSMGDALAEIKDMPFFVEFAEKMSSNAFLSLFAGTALTALVQASSATISAVQTMYQSGALTLMAVLPFVYGANIGTTVTGILAAIGGSTAAKRTAGIHTLFNIVGTTIGMILLVPYAGLINTLTDMFHLNGMMQISVAHILFNSLTTVVFFPFLKQMCALVEKVIPGEDTHPVMINTDALDESLASSFPSGALEAADSVIQGMFDAVKENVNVTRNFLSGKEKEPETIFQNEATINDLDKKITNYLLLVSGNENINADDRTHLAADLETVKNLERIGDLSINIVEFVKMIHDDGADLSEAANKECARMFDAVEQILDGTKDVHRTKSQDTFEQVEAVEQSLDRYEKDAMTAHFQRMRNKECTSAVANSVYCDILSNLERMGDHSINIAESSLGMDHHGK